MPPPAVNHAFSVLYSLVSILAAAVVRIMPMADAAIPVFFFQSEAFCPAIFLFITACSSFSIAAFNLYLASNICSSVAFSFSSLFKFFSSSIRTYIAAYNYISAVIEAYIIENFILIKLKAFTTKVAKVVNAEPIFAATPTNP